MYKIKIFQYILYSFKVFINKQYFLHLPFQVQEDLPKEMGDKIFQFKSDKDVEKAWNKIHDKVVLLQIRWKDIRMLVDRTVAL